MLPSLGRVHQIRRHRSAVLIVLVGSLLRVPAAASQAPQYTHAASGQVDSTVVSVTLIPRSDSTPLAQLAAATRAARRLGRTPIVEIGAPWCEPCHILEGLLQTPTMQATMRHMYIISLNNDFWQRALDSVGFDVTTGIPRMVVIDSTGRPVGEPWRPRDVPDSLSQQLGVEGAWRKTLTALFVRAQQQFLMPSRPARVRS